MRQYLPLLVGAVCAAMVIVSRLLTNRHVRMHITEIIAAGTAVGRVPLVFSAIYMVGFVGLIAAFVWAFISVGWWASLIVAGFYAVTECFRSVLARRKR